MAFFGFRIAVRLVLLPMVCAHALSHSSPGVCNCGRILFDPIFLLAHRCDDIGVSVAKEVVRGVLAKLRVPIEPIIERAGAHGLNLVPPFVARRPIENYLFG